VSERKVVERDESVFRIGILDGLEMGISETRNFKLSLWCSDYKNCGEGMFRGI
jgi:hypothetical protein